MNETDIADPRKARADLIRGLANDFDDGRPVPIATGRYAFASGAVEGHDGLSPVLTPSPPPEPREFEWRGLQPDPKALADAVAMMKAAGYRFEEDETPGEDEKPPTSGEGQP
jgi:hypothetical protein